MHEILGILNIQTDYQMPDRRPDTVLMNEKEKGTYKK